MPKITDMGADGHSKALKVMGVLAAVLGLAIFGLGLGAFWLQPSPKVDAKRTQPLLAKQVKAESWGKAQLIEERRRRETEEMKEALSQRIQKEKEEQRKEEALREWRLEAKGEYLQSLRLRANRMETAAVRIGSITKRQVAMAERNLQRIQSIADNVEYISRIDRIPRSIIDSAADIAPQYIHGVLREHGMQVLAKMGKGDTKRLPWQERKKLHEAFAGLIGEPDRQWGLGTPFDDLDAKEMKELIDALRQAGDNFRTLSKHQRLLILDAGAEEFFRRQAGIEK